VDFYFCVTDGPFGKEEIGEEILVHVSSDLISIASHNSYSYERNHILLFKHLMNNLGARTSPRRCGLNFIRTLYFLQ